MKMTFSGLRKQFNKMNQYLSETVGSAAPTKLDEIFNEMERNIDTTHEFITAFVNGVNEYLQPNTGFFTFTTAIISVIRARKASLGTVSKVSGNTKTASYPQHEGILADIMLKYGLGLGQVSDLGKALVELGEAFHEMAEIKYKMENDIKQHVLDPLLHLQENELKEVAHHRNKLKGRRLDYDCKKRQGRVDEEMSQAEEKLEESKRAAEMAMYNVISNDVEQLSQLRAFVDAQLEYHKQTVQILDRLQRQLNFRINDVGSRPRTAHVPELVLPTHKLTTASIPAITYNVSTNSTGSVMSAITAQQEADLRLIDIDSHPSMESSFLDTGNESRNTTGVSGTCWTELFATENPIILQPETVTKAEVDQQQKCDDVPSSNNVEYKPVPWTKTNPVSNSSPMRSYSPIPNDPTYSTAMVCPEPFEYRDRIDSTNNEHCTLSPAGYKVPPTTPVSIPCCTALFTFESQNPEDLEFKQGAVIELVSQIDDNWFEGQLDGKKGLFPANYVQVLVPLS